MKDKRALKEFYDRVGAAYPEEEQVYRTLRGRLRKRFVIEWLRAQTGALLEIGTNRGMYLHYYEGVRVGVDLSQSALQRARRGASVFYAVADAERLCFKSGAFDRVLCSELLEHCFHPAAVFDSIYQVLKSGGCALLTTPNYRGERPTWVALGAMADYGVTGDQGARYFHTAYRPQELAEYAERAGLQVVRAGTLEKEVKYAAKIPAAILKTGRWLNKRLKSARFARWNQDLFQHLSLLCYNVAHYTLLERVALLFVKEGVRSYIIMRKGEL
ncbi:methyltransferase domain-containing protein [candidate division KSB1 bacterium]|nr:methyltransferase domain-containing protein [candidate division KSB1 bacterium]RQW05361.1 MAG: class I SAM-dependent methyltransferase [candidate division KSB1 bacterium]